MDENGERVFLFFTAIVAFVLREDPMDDILLYLALGAAAGFMAGLLGIGGGLITVPALAYLLSDKDVAGGNVMHLAIGTSLAAMTVTTAVAAYTHHRHRAVNWSVWRRLIGGLVLGSILGALVVDHLSNTTLRIVFGMFELALAAHIAFSQQNVRRSMLPAYWKIAAAGLAIGALSAMLGIGGGLFVVPYLLWYGVSIRAAVATAAATAVAIAGTGAATFMVLGLDTAHGDATWGHIHQGAFAGIALGSLASAPLGAYLAHRLPAPQLRRIFALVIAVLGLAMVAS